MQRKYKLLTFFKLQLSDGDGTSVFFDSTTADSVFAFEVQVQTDTWMPVVRVQLVSFS